jgi:hypothetical protein
MLKLDVSLGEAIDKWNILHIKKNNIHDENKLQHIQTEINSLHPILENFLIDIRIQKLYSYLNYFNQKIWELCDKVRVADVNMFEDSADVQQKHSYTLHCVDIIKYNDARFRVKHKINECGNSFIKEMKNFNGSCIWVNIPPEYNEYVKAVPLIRYLSFCYDRVIIPVYGTLETDLSPQFQNFNVIFSVNQNFPPTTKQLLSRNKELSFCIDICQQLTVDYDKIYEIFYG